MLPETTEKQAWCDRTTKAYPVSCRNRSVTSGPNLAMGGKMESEQVDIIVDNSG
jgi:hypothetical protein